MEKIILSKETSIYTIEEKIINTIKIIANHFDNIDYEDSKDINIKSFIKDFFKKYFVDYEFAYNYLINYLNNHINNASFKNGFLFEISNLIDINQDNKVYRYTVNIEYFKIDINEAINIIENILGVSYDFAKTLYENEAELTNGCEYFLEGIKKREILNDNYFDYKFMQFPNVDIVYSNDKKYVYMLILDELKKNNKTFLDLLNGLSSVELNDGYISFGNVIYDNDGNVKYILEMNWKKILENENIIINDIKPYGIKLKINKNIEDIVEKYSVEVEDDNYKDYIPDLSFLKEQILLYYKTT